MSNIAEYHWLLSFYFVVLSFRCKKFINFVDVHIASTWYQFPSPNRPFSYSEKESGPNDISLHFVEFSNV